MTETWTTDRIMNLAPDAGSGKSGRDLAHAKKWKSIGRNAQSLWGEIQGSGKNPYQTRIDLSEPAFKCTCPSRKFPCKHAIGLFLILAEQPSAVMASEPPEWVLQWLADRALRSQKKEEKKESAAAAEIADPEAQAKRSAKREARVTAGIDELDQWLRDLVRQGLAWAHTQPGSFWENAAARMVDAQAPGVARLIRDLSGAAHAREGWQERLLERIGRIHLLIQAWRRIDALPPDVQADVRSLLGFTQSQDDLLTANGMSDCWTIVGKRIDEEDRLKVQRTWLRGHQSRRSALILDFAAPGQTLDSSLIVGTEFEGEVVYFSGAVPMRGLVKAREYSTRESAEIAGFDSVSESFAEFGRMLATNPWIEVWPMALRGLRIHRDGENWKLIDATDRTLCLSDKFDRQWELMSICGGEPISVFGEWHGNALLPLGAASNGRFYDFMRGRAA